MSAHGAVTTLFAQALALHRAGRLGEAEILYKQILAVDARHVQVLTNLGTIHLQRGHREEGMRLIGLSLEINPNQPHAHNNLGNVLRGIKRLDEALASYDRAIALKPDAAEAHYNVRDRF
jgi:tetratricopeptide (TPR) repeat protein